MNMYHVGIHAMSSCLAIRRASEVTPAGAAIRHVACSTRIYLIQYMCGVCQ